MHDVELTRPYPPILNLASRLLAEHNMGGVSLRIWREAYPNEQLAELIELKSVDFIVWALADAYREESDYHPTVRFWDESRAAMFSDWLRGQQKQG